MDIATHFCSVMGIFAIFQNIVPPPLRHFMYQLLDKWWDRLFNHSNPYSYLEIPEFKRDGCRNWNSLYHDVEVYLSSTEKAMATQRANIHRPEASKRLTFSLAMNVEVEDSFQGANVWWVHNSIQKGHSDGEERKNFTLRMLKGDRPRLLTHYLDHIAQTAAAIEHLNTERYLFTNNGSGDWDEVLFNHPSTFETLAIESDLKGRIKADLKAFAEGEEFYHRVGRAWKRGYLLYGPPGTGKSSMIAAMANFLNYDVYDLELTKVSDNSELRSLLIGTTKKSIIVIEDIDCTLDLSDRSASSKSEGSDESSKDSTAENESLSERSSRVTLSGLLNFTDGLWSCCGEERIIVFTTNHKDRLDPALLRSGRMDFHILLSYCTFNAFKLLASNYLCIQEHQLYDSIEQLINAGAAVTPAELGEILIENKDNPDAALEKVISALQPGNTTRDHEACNSKNQQTDQQNAAAEGYAIERKRSSLSAKAISKLQTLMGFKKPD